MVIDVYKTIFFGRADPQLFIPPRDLDLLIRSSFELLDLDFNYDELSQIYQSLCTHGEQSRFYSDVLESDGF